LVVRDAAGDDPDRSVLHRQPAPTIDAGEQLSQAQRMQTLWGAVDRLSPQQRAALLLHVQEEQSTSEIAAVLQCSEATVRVHLHRAVSALRKTVGQG
jgi:RNA polymerase sigma factor (sigma-70 family)